MKIAVFANAVGASATSAALLIAGQRGIGWPAIAAIMVVSAVLAVTLNVLLRVRARQERMRMRHVAVRAMRASEEEREELARTLSDEAAQTLAGALLHLKAARAIAPDGEEDWLTHARRAIVATMEQLEKGSAALKPSLLELVSTEAAIASMARGACDAEGIRLNAKIGGLGPLSSGRAMALFRITQEAIDNVVEHAHASELRLETGRDGSDAVVVIRDDGAGFEVRTTIRPTGGALGLSTMSELAAYWGGSVRFDSRPGSGTRVEIRLSLETEPIDA